MPIDINKERVLSLHEAIEQWPAGPRPSMAALNRWRVKGVKSTSGDRVKLETIRIGGKRVTSLEAISRFIEAQNRKPLAVA